MKYLTKIKGKYLNEWGYYIGLERKWFERIPFIGDMWFRKRLVCRLRGLL